MKKVFVNGYGTIGSRIAKFIKDDPDIDYNRNWETFSQMRKCNMLLIDGFSVFVPEKIRLDSFNEL